MILLAPAARTASGFPAEAPGDEHAVGPTPARCSMFSAGGVGARHRGQRLIGPSGAQGIRLRGRSHHELGEAPSHSLPSVQHS